VHPERAQNPGSGSEKEPVELERRYNMNALTLYRPRFLENTFGDFDRYLDSFFGDSFLAPSERIFNRAPMVDVRETEKAYIIEAELPGYDEKDIEVRLDGNTLAIESKKVEEKASGDAADSSAKAEGNYLIRERRLSSFSRSFKLPENANHEEVSASFKNGILSLEINKRAEAQTKLIQISKN